MKKILLAIAVLAMTVSCAKKPFVVEGNIEGYNGKPVIIRISENFDLDTIKVNEDGSFRYEKYFDQTMDSFLGILETASNTILIIPGETSHYDIDLTVKPAEFNYSGNNQDVMDFMDYYRKSYAVFHIEDNFKAQAEYWDNAYAAAMEKAKVLKNKKAREYYTKKVSDQLFYGKISYGYKFSNNDISIETDPDFYEFFNSIDFSKDPAKKSIITLANMKATTYDRSIPASLRMVKALDELSTDKAYTDSLALKQIDRTFLENRYENREEVEGLTAKARELGMDEEKLAKYTARAEKTLSLVRGCDAIDIEMFDLNGKAVKLSDFKGKAVYMDLWATWCIPCCLQIPYMEKVAEKYKNDKRIVFISLSLDSMKDVEDWKAKVAADKPFWPQYRTNDAGKAVMNDYAFAAIPRFMLFDKDGKIYDADAPRPQDIDALSALIDEML